MSSQHRHDIGGIELFNNNSSFGIGRGGGDGCT